MRVRSLRRCFGLLLCLVVLILGKYIVILSSFAGHRSSHVARTRLRSKLNLDETEGNEYNTALSVTNISSNIRTDNKEQEYYTIEEGFIIPKTLKGRRRIYQSYYKRTKPRVFIDCNRIVAGDKKVIQTAAAKFKWYKRTKSRKDPFRSITDCAAFKQGRGYIDHPLTLEELAFPIAFGILVYKDIEQIERLFRAIYRPQHYYCFHVDLKDNKEANNTYNGLRNIVKCFNNVFVPTDRVSVVWGEITILEAELVCMKQLWQAKRWKYYINLTGQEFPLKTNLEIVKILTAMDGANVLYGTKTRPYAELKDRWIHAGLPPHNIKPIIGSTHIAVNRDYIDFALHDQRSKDFIRWLGPTVLAEETFFPSLNYNPHLGIPGSFLGEAEEYPLNAFFLRYKNWARYHGVYLRDCHGKFVRNICILGLGDISKAVKDIGLYANKFFYEYEPLGYDCLEEWLNEHTWKQYVNDEPYDTSYYRSLDQPKYQLRKGENNTILMW